VNNQRHFALENQVHTTAFASDLRKDCIINLPVSARLVLVAITCMAMLDYSRIRVVIIKNYKGIPYLLAYSTPPWYSTPRLIVPPQQRVTVPTFCWHIVPPLIRYIVGRNTVEPLYKHIVGTRPYMLILQVLYAYTQGHMISPRDLRIIKINL
jgi:hypothetical protein